VGGCGVDAVRWVQKNIPTSQHFFLESPGAEKVEKKKSNCANYLCPSWLAQGEERTENQQPSTGLCIQMVRSWVLVYAGPVNHPLQDYYNLVADETPLSQLKTGVAFGLGNLYL
jgi:hypothetical protein